MKLTEHFKLEDFSCRDGTPYPWPWIEERLRPLCNALEIVRTITGRPMIITSGYRTEGYNRKVGGATKSRHKEGLAADFKLEGITPRKLFPILDRFQRTGILPKGGLHAYATFTHIDIAGDKIRRW